MYLETLKLWNFRKYGHLNDQITPDSPDLVVEFNHGLNLLIGENESGKSTVLDAIRFILRTQSYDYSRIVESDFHYDGSGYRKKLRIECMFKDFSDAEAGQFLEWICLNEQNDYELRVWLNAEVTEDNRIITDIRSGADDVGTRLDGNAADLLRITYLKPLRDAEQELTAGRRSRFAQLLKKHKIFDIPEEEKENHLLVSVSENSREKIEEYFKVRENSLRSNTVTEDNKGAEVTERIEELLIDFTGEERKPNVTMTGTKLWQLLHQLNLTVDQNQTSLGVLNLLYMAAELIMLADERLPFLRLLAVEELEAHLHPNYQLNVLKAIERRNKVQSILTTHSTVLASSTKIDNLVLFKGKKVFPIGSYSSLDHNDKLFLSRFLEYTRSNLFLCKGVIIVEGYSENLLIPAIAEIITGHPLHYYGVSVVNVGSKALMRYAKIFQPKDVQNDKMDVKVSIIYDDDVYPKDRLRQMEKKPKVYTKEHNDTYLIETDKQRYNELLEQHGYGIESAPVKVELEEGMYDAYIEYKRTAASKLFDDYDHDIFDKGNSEWTLEFSLAKSCLSENLLTAMYEAKMKSKASVHIPETSNATVEVTDVFYKDNTISKALTAQLLADNLLSYNNREELKSKILGDDSLEFIVKSIKHVCRLNEL